MTSLCIKYSGLKFNYIFETDDFVFIPMKELEDLEKDRLELEEIFSCEYDKSSNFYVLLKEPGEFDFTLKNFSEVHLYKFKLLESILSLLFSNYLRRDCIFILDKIDSKYTVKKIFKNLSKEITKDNQPLLWKNNIIINYLQEIVDAVFVKLKSIAQKKDFAVRYSFCVDMYLRGKFEKNRLRVISDLWISLEILATITVSYILHSHELFKVDDNFENLKKVVENYAFKLPIEDVDCWAKMKKKFPEYMKNKINSFLPIFKKCVKVAEEYLDINDLKVKLNKEEDYKDSAKYQEYLSKVKDFKDYQDGITIKKILENFYKYRNRLFHGGKISDKWSLKSDRYEANFIKILEQLFFRVLDLNMIFFYQMGYPHQRIFGLPNEEGKQMDLGNFWSKTSVYIHKKHILPLKEDFKIHFNDFEIARKNYLDITHQLDPLRYQLNSSLDKVLIFLEETHPVQLIFDENSYNYSLNYQNIKDRTLNFTFGYDSVSLNEIYSKKQVIIKNQDVSVINSEFLGMFDDNEIIYGDNFVIPFLLKPPYISFEFKSI